MPAEEAGGAVRTTRPGTLPPRRGGRSRRRWPGWATRYNALEQHWFVSGERKATTFGDWLMPDPHGTG